jgi:hypothetical protein
VDISLYVNGKQACDSRAIYKPGKGNWVTIDHMTYCSDPIKVSKGDNITLQAFYDHEQYSP